MADFTMIIYLNNPESGRFEKQPLMIALNKLPFELKVESTQDQRIKGQGANQIITGRIKGGKREFFTGLIPVSPNWYYGNDYEYIGGKRKLSLVVFNFTDDNSKMVVYYFNHFYKENRNERLNFCLQFIQSLNA